MQKPYTDVFYLSYTGIIQTKKFNKLRQNGKKTKNEETNNNGNYQVQNDKKNKNEENQANHRESNKSYKLNKSKIRGRAIAFSRLPKSRKNFYFYTLSFPSQLSDNHCFEVFNILMTRLRKNKEINDYLWVTERQKNGTLHFHWFTNDLYSVRKANNFVRASLLFKLNRKEFDYDRKKIENFNGLDIAKNRKTKKVVNFAKEKCKRLIINYLTKYITKNEISFYRLPFHSSHSISKLKKSVEVSDYEAVMIFSEFDSKNITPKTVRNDWYSWFGFSNDVKEEAFEIIDMYNELIYSNLPLPTKTAPIFIDNPSKPIKKRIQFDLF